MKILFCIATPKTRELGAPKILLELAEEMEPLGWHCDILCPLDFVSDRYDAIQVFWNYHLLLRDYLQQHAADYDVVEYDHGFLPFPRSDFPSQTLFVTRAVLLAHHFDRIKIPSARSWKSRLRSWLTLGRDDRQRRLTLERAPRTVAEADLVNVANQDDRAELIRQGIPAEKIVVIPYGMSQSSRPQFDAIPELPPAEPVVAFVGTFDDRKGAADFPAIVAAIAAQVPAVRFRLLGTARSADRVLAHFPQRLRPQIEVVPTYAAADLPQLLTGCAVGIFPSYLESFGFGVLEMLAAAIPVIAYDAPGPPMMLPPEYLVPPGETTALAAKVIHLLHHPQELTTARRLARQRSRQFCWPEIAQQTSQLYQAFWQKRQVPLSPLPR
ncbi:hypothetical protein BST81_08600 [Leptolyngbya sp. 'hensonii']|uniref:glycosyltransferase family 4 protein n=1 Tax=Leptolyngbya sp. 'hensonii' TaxID=1922337 RepID=UPI00094FF510|nr:glycosyltransferase family 4 protein [Leptolyngbya sp. 'hensonii']OLP18789.1 hypothetical protein BST81_08600 [Leptolyngbya sp. 'hensonii']